MLVEATPIDPCNPCQYSMFRDSTEGYDSDQSMALYRRDVIKLGGALVNPGGRLEFQGSRKDRP
jgi:hypothetical protein